MNPRNWFGGKEEPAESVAVDEVQPDPAAVPPIAEDGRRLVSQVTSVAVERIPGGAILRAQGIASGTGNFNASLEPLNDEFPINGVLIYAFRIATPEDADESGAVQPVVVAHYLSDWRLRGVRQVRVVAETNTASAAR